MTLNSEHRDLLLATREFQEQSSLVSFVHVAPTMILIVICSATLMIFPSIYLLPISLLLGLLLVRSFIIFHDVMHRAVFRKSGIGRSIVSLFSILSVFSPSVWKYRHNAHHKQNTRLNDFLTEGQFPILSVSVYRKIGKKMQRRYRQSRNPFWYLIAYIRFFVYETLKTFLKNPRLFWTSPVWVALHIGLLSTVGYWFGAEALLLSLLIPLWLSTMIGSYLFYVQHNFEGMELKAFDDWNYVDAALHSSSMFDMPGILHWFTGNIGYHHIHHLNPSIPFYRLSEAYNSIPELQSAKKVNWSITSIVSSFSLTLWDEENGTLVSAANTKT
jgi:omega-6 fatty acid desaturase (delta-12 desaturase)